MADPAGIYISVPFCRAKCTYCNFASGVFGAERMEQYVDAVCAEIAAVRAAGVGKGAELPSSVDTIFFGGGTPSLLSAEQMRRLFGAVRGEFEIAAGAEVTLECAPGQLDDETFREMLRQGMNRVSFGVQSFVDAEARAVGRLHTREMCKAEIARMRSAGVDDINVDLIVGLPGQTAASWRESVEMAIESGVPHVSVYMLEVDEDSRLGREMLQAGSRYGAGNAASEDEAAEWYGAACEWLEAAGVRQYEISNFARQGRASRHNLKYWRRENYLGFGLDAHSMLRTGVGGVRWANTDDLDRYMSAGGEDGGSGKNAVRGSNKNTGLVQLASAEDAEESVGTTPVVEVINREKAFEESLFLGLRINDGVDLAALRMQFGDALMRVAVGVLEDVEEAGLVVRDGSRVRLTARGRMASNEVFGRLLVEETVRQ